MFSEWSLSPRVSAGDVDAPGDEDDVSGCSGGVCIRNSREMNRIGKEVRVSIDINKGDGCETKKDVKQRSVSWVSRERFFVVFLEELSGRRVSR